MSNCVVSMISPQKYEEFVLPLDQKLSLGYARFGVHTCNWVIDPYVDSLRKIEKMDYIDTGIGSDLERMKRLFPNARRAVLYTPGEAQSQSLDKLTVDLTRIACEYALCDVLLADVEMTTSPEKIKAFLGIAAKLSAQVTSAKNTTKS